MNIHTLAEHRALYEAWLKRQAPSPCILPGNWTDYSITWLDLRAETGPFAEQENVTDVVKFDTCIQQMLEEAGAQIGLGGYGEKRAFYNTDAYATTNARRDTHLGLDIWTTAGTPVLATLPGVVQSIQDNPAERDYGPTLIVRHEINEPTPSYFYTLYGHLAAEVLTRWSVGDHIEVGDRLAYIGDRPGNGNWPPHLHFQVILDLLDYVGDFPGVASATEREYWLRLCPDPAPLLNCNNLK